MIKVIMTTVVLLLVLLYISGTATAQNEAQSATAGNGTNVLVRDSVQPLLRVKQLSIGGQVSDIKDYGGKVAEYEVLDKAGRPQFGLEALGGSHNSRFWLLAAHRATEDQSYAAKFRLADVLRTSFDYSKFRHWLDHDPLAYGVEVQGLPPIRKVYKRDDDPGSTYQVNRSLTDMKASVRIPGASFLTAHTSLRSEARHGFQQAVSYNMCQSCHITSRERGVNQLVSDYSIGAAVQINKATVDYTFSYRDYEDKHANPELYYGGPNWNPDTALFSTWPTGPQSYYDKRLYNDKDLPYGLNPSYRKLSHLLQISHEVSPKLSVLWQGAYTTTDNRYSGAVLSQANADVLATLRASRKLTLSARYGFQRIDNDDVLPTKIATLNALMDTADIYYPTEENLINSALTRTTHDADLNGSYRLRGSTNLLFGIGYGSIDRDNFGTDATTEVRANVGVSTRPFKKGHLKIEYFAAFTDNPFSNPRAGKEDPPDTTLIKDSIYSHFARVIRTDPLAADPTDRHEIKIRFNGSLGGAVTYALGGSWKSRVNDETEWESKTLTPYINLGYALSPTNSLSAGYSYSRDRGRTLFSAPDMVLKAGQLLYHHGSFYRLIPYNEDAHTINVSGLTAVSKRVSLNISATYVIAKAFYDTKEYIGVADHADATDTLDLRNLNQFSQHDYHQLWLNIGMEYNLWSNVFLALDAGFNDFDNKKVYLYDMSGRTYTLSAAVTLRDF